jgi:nickel-dependent lactate racemase
MNIFETAKTAEGLSNDEIAKLLERSLEGRELKNVLIIPPDFTRFHSNAGYITQVYYKLLTERGVEVDIMPALGTHVPVSESQWKTMFGDISYSKMIVHNWRTDVVKLGEVPADVVAEISGGLWKDPVSVEVNRRIMDEKYDLIISPGQVVPHEVIGMANHAKNLFVGVGGSDMINKSHMIGAVCGMEDAMGRDHTPVRRLFDYALEKYMQERPILWVLTVNTAPGGNILSHGLFIGEGRECLTEAVKLAQEKNIDYVERGIKKCVVYLEPSEFTSTWLGNKSVYRTRMAMADGGELLIVAPGLKRFGEQEEVDALIRKYGYSGTENVMRLWKTEPILQDLTHGTAHLIHGSSEGRFKITYAPGGGLTKDEIESVCFGYADLAETLERYNPEKMKNGLNVMPDGEEVFFIDTPSAGLWSVAEKMEGRDA